MTQATWLSREELAQFAGPQPVDERWLRKTHRAWMQWRVLRGALADNPGDRKEIQGEIGHAVGHHRLVWKVRGITRRALEHLAGADGMFNHTERKGFQRAHLHTWMGLLDLLVECPIDLTLEQWRAIVWEHDVTVICVGEVENHMLDSTKRSTEECQAFFKESVAMFHPADGHFEDTGSTFTYRKRTECKFLKSLHTCLFTTGG